MDERVVSEENPREAFSSKHDDILLPRPLLISPYSLYGLGSRASRETTLCGFENKIFSSSTRYLTFLRTWWLGERHEAGEERERASERVIVSGPKAGGFAVCDMGRAGLLCGRYRFSLVGLVLKRLHGVMRIWESLMWDLHAHVHRHLMGHGVRKEDRRPGIGSSTKRNVPVGLGRDGQRNVEGGSISGLLDLFIQYLVKAARCEGGEVLQYH